MKRVSMLVALGLLVGASGSAAWTSVRDSNLEAADHEVEVLLGVPGGEGHRYRVTVSEDQLKDVMDGSAIMVKVDGAENDELVAQVTVKEKKSSRRRGVSSSGGGAAGASGGGGDSGW